MVRATMLSHLLKGCKQEETPRSYEKPEGPYLGALLSPAPPRVAVQMTSKNIQATCGVSPQLKALEVA